MFLQSVVEISSCLHVYLQQSSRNMCVCVCVCVCVFVDMYVCEFTLYSLVKYVRCQQTFLILGLGKILEKEPYLSLSEAILFLFNKI